LKNSENVKCANKSQSKFIMTTGAQENPTLIISVILAGPVITDAPFTRPGPATVRLRMKKFALAGRRKFERCFQPRLTAGFFYLKNLSHPPPPPVNKSSRASGLKKINNSLIKTITHRPLAPLT
jgi:hypothetical protein